MRVDQLRFELQRRFTVGKDFEQPDFANLKRRHLIPLLNATVDKAQEQDRMVKSGLARTRQRKMPRKTKGRRSTRLHAKRTMDAEEEAAKGIDADTEVDEPRPDDTDISATSTYTLSIKGMKDISKGTGVGCLLEVSNSTTPVWSHGVYFPASRTGYEAEYTALILGLRRLDATTDTLLPSSSPSNTSLAVTIQTDNEVVYEQMGTRRFPVRKPSLITMADQVDGLLKFHLQHHWSVQWKQASKSEFAPVRQLAAQALEEEAPEPGDMMIDDDPMESFWDSVLPMPLPEEEEVGGIEDEAAGDYETEQVLTRLFVPNASRTQVSSARQTTMTNGAEQDVAQIVNPFAHFDDDDYEEEEEYEETEDGHSSSTSLQSQDSLDLSQAAASLDPSFTYTLQFDGGSRGNPGVAGCGAAIIVNDNPAEYGGSSEVWCGYQFLGSSGVTNNQAEYQGFIFGLQRAHALGVRNIQCQGDSQLVIRQLRGEYKVKNERLQELHTTATACMELFDRCELQHVMRKDNQRADMLANAAMDRQSSFDDAFMGKEP